MALILGGLSIVSRIAAPFNPDAFSSHLAYASILLMLALIIWGWRVIKLMLARR
jgi:hypothetical protein